VDWKAEVGLDVTIEGIRTGTSVERYKSVFLHSFSALTLSVE